MGKSESKLPAVSSCMTADGLKMKTILLAKNLRPSKFKDSKLEAQPANELIKRNTDSSAEDMVSALGSTENIYSLGDCGLFAAIITA